MQIAYYFLFRIVKSIQIIWKDDYKFGVISKWMRSLVSKPLQKLSDQRSLQTVQTIPLENNSNN